MIETARHQAAVAANASLTTLYWQVGHRVRTEVLDGHRAEYGAQIVSALGRQLQTSYGRSFGEKSLRHMVRFAETIVTESPANHIFLLMVRDCGDRVPDYAWDVYLAFDAGECTAPGGDATTKPLIEQIVTRYAPSQGSPET